MIERVTLTPRKVDAQEFASIASLVQLGRIPEAWQRFQAACLNDGAIARLGGVVNAALEQQPVAMLDWGWMLPAQYATPWQRLAPGIVVAITVPPGPVSFQVSGGVGQAWISDSPTFDSPATSYGMGGSGWITSPGGVVYGVLRVATAELECRFERGAG